MASSKSIFEDEIVISKLMGEPRAVIADIGHVPTEVVVFDGVPLTLRMFMILAINTGSGQPPEQKADEKLSKEIEEFWNGVGFIRPEGTRKQSNHQPSYIGVLLAKVLSGPVDEKKEDVSSFSWVRGLILNYLNTNKEVEMRVVIDKLLDDLRAYHRDRYPPQQQDHQSLK